MTQLTRREILACIGAAVVLPFVPRIVGASVQRPAKRPFSVGQLLVTSFPAVRAELLRTHPWVSPDLTLRTHRGQIAFQPLGPTVEHQGLSYSIQELSVPMVWTDSDERRNVAEKDLINLVHSLLVNAFDSHDDCLLMKLGCAPWNEPDTSAAHRMLVSKQYHYDIGCEQVFGSPDDPYGQGHCVKLYTAFVLIPAETT